MRSDLKLLCVYLQKDARWVACRADIPCTWPFYSGQSPLPSACPMPVKATCGIVVPASKVVCTIPSQHAVLALLQIAKGSQSLLHLYDVCHT